MNDAPYIPQKTMSEMQSSHPPGSRHAAMFKIAIPLIGNGMSPAAVHAQLRATFPDADKTDKEIADVVAWCVERAPTPSGYGPQSNRMAPPACPALNLAPTTRAAVSPTAHADWWLGGVAMDEPTLCMRSPVDFEAMRPDALFAALYTPTDCISLVTAFIHDPTANKARPCGAGKTLLRDEWLQWFSSKGVPQSDAGAWMRPNPVAPTGTGKGGAPMDADVTAYRFLLVESDILPLDVQLALYAYLPLPVAAVILSGGTSAHAWVRLDCANTEEYEISAKRVLDLLAPFGFDQANKNPSRLSRLPGATRKIGSSGDGAQRIVYLNPNAPPLRDFATLEASLLAPRVSERPFKALFDRAVIRYEDLEANRGKLGVPTGITGFDEVSGGLKGGQMIVIAAETNGGKSTFALNIINHAAKNGHGVALFTMEMDRDEVFDNLLSMNARINRNVFNTGCFTEGDMRSIQNMIAPVSALPIWINDDAVLTVAQIRARCLQLVSSQGIKLVVVDYIQFVTADASFKDNREQQIANISRGLRSLAKELKVPVIALSQLNDDGKIRESRVIAHDAHVVILIEPQDGALLAKVVKGRSIPKGDYLMRFEPQFCRLTYQEASSAINDTPPKKRRWGQ